MTIQLAADTSTNESSFSTDIWHANNQLNASHIGSHDIWTVIYDFYMTHSNKKLDQDFGDDEICRAQNENSGERIEKYAFPAICSLELDSPV